MIKIENASVTGWEQAIHGCRNPYNSWGRSDTYYENYYGLNENGDEIVTKYGAPIIGPNDHDLMLRLAKAGPEHAKYRRMIVVYADITAPLYWWKEADTYKVGTVANSCSTMHYLHKKEFTLDDFSHEHLFDIAKMHLLETIKILNIWRDEYNQQEGNPQKDCWWQMIQLLPTSYNQRRTVMLNYEVLSAMYRQRKGHKLDEWNQFCEWIEDLPYSELITLKEPDTTA